MISNAATQFVEKLKRNGYPGKGNSNDLQILIYIDHAETLATSSEGQLPDQIRAFQTVAHHLNQSKDLPIYFVFLSADHRVISRELAPQIVRLASASGVDISKGVKPYTDGIELPLDIHTAKNISSHTGTPGTMDKPLTLGEVSRFEYAVRFGRPL